VEFKTNPDGSVHVVDPAGVDEERRLFYVGITRAKEKLFLSRCRARSARGKEVERIPTRFLSDIPRELTIRTEVEDLVPLTQQQQKKRFDAAFSKIGGKPKFD
jgi:DNA helicase-2/ATP-dependent DNA helicase PcrA